MNRKILQKVIDALNKPDADLSYIRGILETLIDSLPEEYINTSVFKSVSTPVDLPLPNPNLNRIFTDSIKTE